MAQQRKKMMSYEHSMEEERDKSDEYLLQSSKPTSFEFTSTNVRKLYNSCSIKLCTGCLCFALVSVCLVFRSLFLVDLSSTLPDRRSFETVPSQYTVRMNTFRRNEELRASVDHISQCPSVAQIQIIWSDQQNEPPDISFFSTQAQSLVIFEVHSTDSLNNRFKALSPLPTNGVFSVDDDIIFDCEDLTFAFETWRASSNTMVGFVPRLVTFDESSKTHKYLSWWYTWWNGAYNLVLTKAAFFDRKYLSNYAALPETILSYIDQHKNCEDLAMSIVIAMESNAPPVWVHGGYRELGAVGISSDYNAHIFERSRCIDYFGEVLGGVPLILSQSKVVRAQKLWIWTR